MDVSAPLRPVPVPVPVTPRTAARPLLHALVAVALLSTAVAVDPGGLRPFTSLRWAVTSTAVALAASVTVRRPGSHRLPAWAVAAGLALIGSMAVAAAVVGEATTAWLGHAQRHLGVLAWVVFGAAGVVGAALAGDPQGERRLARAGLAAGAVTAVAALVDLAGWSPLGADFAGGRVGGLLGQPTALAAVAVLLVPLAAAAPADRRLRVAVVAGLLAAVVTTQTRGALLGLAAVVLVSLPALRPRLRPAHLAAVPLAALALATTPLVDRLGDVGASGRADDWRLAAEVVVEHPLLGLGPEGYRLAVPGVLDERYVERYGRAVVIDRAHASPLDVAASGGIGAGVAHLVLLVGVARAAWRLQRRCPWSAAAAAGTGAVGALAAGLVAFPSTEVDTLAWLLGGLAVATDAGLERRGTDRRRPLGIAVAGALAATCLVAGATDVRADRHLARALHLASAGDPAGAGEAATAATDLRPDLTDAWYVSAQVSAAGGTILDLDAALARAVEGRRRSPDDPALRALHATLAVERATRSGLRDDREAALAVVEAAIADDPTHPVLRALRAQLEVVP